MKTVRTRHGEADKTELMNKYSIFIENEKYAYGSHRFDTWEEALHFANEFIDRIACGCYPKTCYVCA
jgi:hypothetical protein